MINYFKIICFIITAVIITSCKGASEGVAPSEILPPNTSVTQLAITPIVKTLAVNNNFNFTATGGTAPYNFSIVSGGGIILTVADVGQFTAPGTSGIVVVQLTDSSGGLVTATITVNSALQISPISQTMMTNATLNMSATGGVSPYFYSVSSGLGSIDSVTGLFTAPAVNTISNLIVTDSIGNTSSSTITVTSLLSLNPGSVSLVVNDAQTFLASGGTPPLVYSLVSGAGSINSSSGLFTAPAVSGTTVIRVTDSLGATANSTATINPALLISPTSITLSVNGSLTFSSTGGIAPNTFSILSGAGSINSTTGAYTAPATSGSAVIRVTDSLGHVSDSNVTVTNALGINPAAKTLAVNNTQIFSATGGTGPFVYSIVSGGGSINGTSGLFTAPATAGTTVVRVTDSLSATANASVTINVALAIAPSSVTKAISSTHTFSATGGVSPYVYSIVSGGGSINGTTGLFTAPATAGTTVVRVTDSLSNISNSTVTIVSALTITPVTKTLAVNNVFTFAGSGGQVPYTYSIFSGGGSIVAATGAYTAPAAAGSAVVRITDAIGQIADSTVTINSALSITPATVSLAVSAAQTFTSSGGVSPYSYSIVSGGGSIVSATGAFTAPAAAGSVTVRVTDSLSNISNATVTVLGSVLISPVTKTLAVNNLFTFSATGGQTPYSFSIVSGGGSMNGATGAYTAPATTGTTVIRVTDALSQISDSTVTINSALTISPVTKTLAVNNTQTFLATGGVSPYSYSIVSGGGSIVAATGVFTAPATAGTVTVRVTDSLSNISNATVTVNAALAISPVSINIVANGTQTFTATGGVSPYSYSIVSGGGSIVSATGAFTAPGAAGTVTVRVTDSLSNTSNATVTVVSAVLISPVSKTLAPNNVFTFSASGGFAPYTYSVFSGSGTINSSTGAYTADAVAGSAVVRVTDSLSQTSDSAITINSALAITPALVTLAVNGTQTFSATGGVSPYSYSIVSGGGSIVSATGAFTAPATTGSVTVRVMDSLLNTSNATVTVNAALNITPAAITLSVNNVTTFSATGGVSPYSYSIVAGGGTINSSTGIFTAPSTAGSVTVRATDSLSNISNATVTVNAAVAISPATVTLAVNGTQTFSATGGVSPYSYSIVSGGGSIVSATGAFTAPATSQVVTVRATDTLSNSSDSTVTINGPLAISPTVLNIVANGSQTFVAAGGLPPYTYSVVSGTGTIDPVLGDYAAGPAAGSDVVRVTDSAATVVNTTVTVYNPLALTPTIITLAINTTQTFTATGGSGTRTFSVVSGGGTINSVSGIYTAPATSGVTVIKVEDALANSLSATISIVSTLTISPQILKLPVFSTVQFSSVLGTTPYTYSIFSGTGSVVPATGLYTGGANAGSDVVRVTDAAMNISNSSVTLIEPVQIVSGSYHNCVRYSDGSVKCWGLNSSGQLGLGDTLIRGDAVNEGGGFLPFVNLGTGRTAKLLAAGYTHTCAILDNDTVKCWGANGSGQLGLGDVTVRGTTAASMGDGLPIVSLGAGRTAKKIVAGSIHTCAILDNDTLKCWGSNAQGQLGQGNITNKGNTAGSMGDSLVPISLGTLKTALEISAGLDHTCVILNDNNLKCFGRNDRGQLGKDSTASIGNAAGQMGDSLTNINLGAGRTAVAISSGYSLTCALLDNGLVKCWGRNQSGQLGLDSNVLSKGTAAGDMASLVGISLGFIPTKISASRQRSCAMNATTMKCWGLNTSGQLLIGNTTAMGDNAGEMAALANINLGTGIVAANISSGWYGSCVITTNKRIKCFGSAVNGYLQNASTTLHLGDVVGEVGNGLPWVNH